MAELFGFSIKKSSKESGSNEKTFVSPTPDDGSIEVAGGGFFGQILDTNGREKNDIDLIIIATTKNSISGDNIF